MNVAVLTVMMPALRSAAGVFLFIDQYNTRQTDFNKNRQ